MTQTAECPPVPETYRGKTLTWTWPYRTQSGHVAGYVARYDGPDGKECIPYLRRNGRGWVSGVDKDFNLLFGTDSLRPESTLPVFVAEGEKAAAALHSLGLQAVTSQGGSGAARKAYWGPLRSRPHVIVLPDNDEPGEHYASTVVEILRGFPDPPQRIEIARLPDLPEKGDVVDWIQARVEWDGYGPIPRQSGDDLVDEFLEAVEAAAEPFPSGTVEATPEAWEEPVSLTAAVLPEWPRDTFPAAIQEFVGALTEAAQVPVELPSLMTLACLSTAAQGRFQVLVLPNYFEPVQVWTCCATEPGTRKTAVFEACIRPIVDFEREQREALEPVLKRENSERKTVLARIEHLRSKAAKADMGTLQVVMDEIASLEATLPAQRYPFQAWTNDATPETIAALMDRHNGCMATLDDEGGLFDMLAGRYQNAPNLDVYLKGHAGSPLRVNRISREDLFIDRPALTIGITPQPGVIRKLGERAEFRDKGLLARFLFALPKDRLGSRTVDARPVPPEVRNEYHRVIKDMLSLPWDSTKQGDPWPNTLVLSREALELWRTAWSTIEGQLADGGSFSHIRDWASKLPGATARIAALLHTARHAHTAPWEKAIALADMSAAVDLADALSRHALIAFDAVGSDCALADARTVLSWIRRTGTKTFTRRDCHYGNKHHFKRVEAVDAALACLTDRGYIRLRPAAITGNPGRPQGATYDTNPQLWKEQV